MPVKLQQTSLDGVFSSTVAVHAVAALGVQTWTVERCVTPHHLTY